MWLKKDRLSRLRRGGLVVGQRFWLGEDVTIDHSHCWHIHIGDDVTLAARVHILAHDTSTKMYLNYTRIGQVHIGNRVFIGAASMVLPGVRIGSDVIVGAGSVVTRDLPDGVIAAGNPARVLGKTEDFIRRKRSEMERVPCFSEEYTVRQGITAELKTKMNTRMIERIGYVI